MSLRRIPSRGGALKAQAVPLLTSALSLAGCGDALAPPDYFGDARIVLELALDGLQPSSTEEVRLQVGGLDAMGRAVGAFGPSGFKGVESSTIALYFPPTPLTAPLGAVISTDEPRATSLLRIWLETWHLEPRKDGTATLDRRLFGIAPHHALLFIPGKAERRALIEGDSRGLRGAQELVEGYNLLELICRPDEPNDELRVVAGGLILVRPPTVDGPCLRLDVATFSNADIVERLTPAEDEARMGSEGT